MNRPMNKEERYDMIERYLNGAMDATEREGLETRLADDPDFRDELGDPETLRLRKAIDNLMQNPPPLSKAYLVVGQAQDATDGGFRSVWFIMN